MKAFYQQIAEAVFASSALTAGPWGPHTQHAGPPSALLARSIEKHRPRPGHRLGRVAIDVLAPIPIAELELNVSTLRSGQRVELLEATARSDGHIVLIARAWRLLEVSDDVPTHPPSAAQEAPLPPARQISFPGAYLGGYMSNIDWRFTTGGFDSFGPARVWARQKVPLLAGEEPTPWQRALVIADSASGASICMDPIRWPAINCDLTVALHRDPSTEWIGLDAQTTVSPHGGALTATTLTDLHGPVGSSIQSLFVSERTNP